MPMWTRLGLSLVVPVAVAAALVATPSAAGKPGYPDKIVWSGLTWDVKTSRSAVGPGPNLFAKANVWVDVVGNLHLRIAKDTNGRWTCAEIIGPSTHGYGTYAFELASRVDNLDPNVVLGLFTWSDKSPYAHRELDIELARWGNGADPTNGQYVVQPWDVANHLRRFIMPADGASLHRFTWRRGQVAWESYGASGNNIDSYAYAGSDVPVTGDERVRLNFWLFNGTAPLNGAAAEVMVKQFSFTP
jgi:hypothetical protein